MQMNLKPIINQWYRHLDKGQRFFVTAVDEDDATVEVQHFDGGESFSDNRRLLIPRGAMHSFEANRNKLRWLVKVKVEIKGWPDYEDEYVLKVLPELA